MDMDKFYAGIKARAEAGENMSVDKVAAAFREHEQALISEKWALGWKDRGLGHGDFAVISESGELIVECPVRSIAEHIINAHNQFISN